MRRCLIECTVSIVLRALWSKYLGSRNQKDVNFSLLESQAASLRKRESDIPMSSLSVTFITSRSSSLAASKLLKKSWHLLFQNFAVP